MKDNSIKSNTIEWLRFFCVVAVVLVHTLVSPENGKDVISFHNGVYDTIRILFSRGLCTVAVPVFFFFSGYLFFVRLEDWNTNIWVGKLKKRGKTLLLPYFFWNLIAIVFFVAVLYIKFLIKGGESPDLAAFYDQIGGLEAFWSSAKSGRPYNFPLWFIRDLIILVIFSPAVYFYVKKTGIVGLLLLYLMYFFRILDNIPGFSEEGRFYFAFGAYFSIRNIDFTDLFKRLWIAAACLAVPPIIVMVLTYGNNNDVWEFAHRLYTLFGSSCIIGIVALLFQERKIKVRKLLSSSSFFVYAAHGTMVLPYITYALGKISPGNPIGQILLYFAAPLTTVLILVLCYRLLSKSMPRTLSVLTGGRG